MNKDSEIFCQRDDTDQYIDQNTITSSWCFTAIIRVSIICGWNKQLVPLLIDLLIISIINLHNNFSSQN